MTRSKIESKPAPKPILAPRMVAAMTFGAMVVMGLFFLWTLIGALIEVRVLQEGWPRVARSALALVATLAVGASTLRQLRTGARPSLPALLLAIAAIMTAALWPS